MQLRLERVSMDRDQLARDRLRLLEQRWQELEEAKRKRMKEEEKEEGKEMNENTEAPLLPKPTLTKAKIKEPRFSARRGGGIFPGTGNACERMVRDRGYLFHGLPIVTAKHARELNLKVKKKNLIYVAPAQMAVEFFNKRNKGSDLVLVEVGTGHMFYAMVSKAHFNFKARSKHVQDDDDDNSSAARLFFAEIESSSAASLRERPRSSGPRISKCSEIKKRFTNGCNFCSGRLKIYHPGRGGYHGNGNAS